MDDNYFSRAIECNERYEPTRARFNGGAKNSNTTFSPSEIENIQFPLQYKINKGKKIYSSIEYCSNKWIEKACDIAMQSVKSKGGPFGAVVVQIDNSTNTVLRYWEANNKVTISNDPTAHAEIMAIRSACKSLGVFNLGEIHKGQTNLEQAGEVSRCEIFSSCEPCPMCFSAIFWARIPVLYFAATRFDAAQPGVEFSDAQIYKELETPYKQRLTKVFQCAAPNALDAFNLWKNSDKEKY